MNSEAAVSPRIPLPTQILLGLSIGAAAGLASNALWRDARSRG